MCFDVMVCYICEQVFLLSFEWLEILGRQENGFVCIYPKSRQQIPAVSRSLNASSLSPESHGTTEFWSGAIPIPIPS